MATTALLCRAKRHRVPIKDVPRSIKIRGNLIEFRAGLAFTPPPPAKDGRRIQAFSKAARLRLLKDVATIDFAGIRNSSFITLTYPPAKESRSYKERTQDRYLLVRKIEWYIGRTVCGYWRTEWKPRLSGRTKGNIAPHIHLLLFAVPYIPKAMLGTWWQQILQYKKKIVVDIRRARGEAGAAYYIAKYCGKVASTSLVNALQLNKVDGRHWGKLRMEMIPRHDEMIIDGPTDEQVSYILDLAHAVFQNNDIREKESFTLMGSYAAEVKKILLDMGLTKCREK